MHEMGLAEDVLKKLLKAANEQKIGKLRKASVNIGETRITDKEEFFDLFRQIAKGTPADGVDLHVTIMPLMAFCNKCSKDFSAKEMKPGCPKCDGVDFKIVSGKEVLVTEVN
jgi:hydrogenase nickel incorporation protein HypA/HybF